MVSLIISKYFSSKYLLILKTVGSLAQDIKKICFLRAQFSLFCGLEEDERTRFRKKNGNKWKKKGKNSSRPKVG